MWGGSCPWRVRFAVFFSLALALILPQQVASLLDHKNTQADNVLCKVNCSPNWEPLIASINSQELSFANSCELGCYFQFTGVNEESVSLENMPIDPLRPKTACVRAWKHVLFNEWSNLNPAVTEADPLPLWLTSLYNSPEMDANEAMMVLAWCLGEDPPVDQQVNLGRVILAEIHSLVPPPGQGHSPTSDAATDSTVDGITSASVRMEEFPETAVINIDLSEVISKPSIDSESNVTAVAPGSDGSDRIQQLPPQEAEQVVVNDTPPLMNPPTMNNTTTTTIPKPQPSPKPSTQEQEEQQQQEDTVPDGPTLTPDITGSGDSELPFPDSNGNGNDTTPATPIPTPKPTPKPSPKPSSKPDNNDVDNTESNDDSASSDGDAGDNSNDNTTDGVLPRPIKPMDEGSSVNESVNQGLPSDGSDEEVDPSEQTSDASGNSSKGSEEEEEKKEEEEKEEINSETPSLSLEDWATPGDYKPVIIIPAFTVVKPNPEGAAGAAVVADLHSDSEHLLQAGGGSGASAGEDLAAIGGEESVDGVSALPQVAMSTSSSHAVVGTRSIAFAITLGTAAAAAAVIVLAC
ncbi:hypothetical protein Ndes2437B_g06633 [Nannochloris sp. 'desiccata']